VKVYSHASALRAIGILMAGGTPVIAWLFAVRSFS
jgi:hypothetical protein